LLESLLMLGEIVNYSGAIDEAERAFDRVIALSQKHQDQFHWASALNNRRGIWIARKDGDTALAEILLARQLAGEGGITTLEFFAQYNAAEIQYQLEKPEAWPHVHRAVEMERRRLGDWARPVALLLQARLLAHRGELAPARAVLREIRLRQERAATEHHPEARFVPSEQVLHDMVDLATSDASESDWDALIERSGRFSVEQEPIEVLEMRGLAAVRAGRLDRGRHWLARALLAAQGIPNLMEARIRAALTRLSS